MEYPIFEKKTIDLNLKIEIPANQFNVDFPEMASNEAVEKLKDSWLEFMKKENTDKLPFYQWARMQGLI